MSNLMCSSDNRKKKHRSQRKLRVCCYCEAWGCGGIEAFWVSIFKRLDLTKYRIDLITAVKLSGFYDSQLEELGISMTVLSGSIRSYPRNYRQLKKIFKRRCYDVVHMNAYQAVTFLYAVCAEECGVKRIIIHGHGSALRKDRGYIWKMAAHTFAKYCFSGSAAECLACSQAARRFLFPDWRRVQLVSNGIDLNQFRYSDVQREQVRSQLHVEGVCVVGMIGRLCMEKNQAFGIEVFREFQKLCKDTVLLIVGEGEAKKDLRRLVRKWGLQEDVIFFGASRQVSKLMQAMDVLLMPSKSEGFGLAAVEAQAAGLPVVCSSQVPEDAFAVRELMSRVPLYKSARLWALVLDRVIQKQHGRTVRDLSGTKYDAYVTTKKIERAWEGQTESMS